MNWIKDHMKLLLIMIVIAALVTIIIISASGASAGGTAEDGIRTVTSTVEKPVSAVGNGLSSFIDGLVHFRSNQRENYKLNQELEELKEELAKAKLSDYELNQLQNLSNELNLSTYDDSYQRITAEVTALDTADFYNIFEISAGTEEGIETDDFVVNQDGLVGRIMDVGKGWAKVEGIADQSNSVSFTLARDPDVTGIISGNGRGSMSGYIFDETKSIIEGDVLITSGLGYYPAGIEIGTVTSVDIDSATRQKNVEAEPQVDFDGIRYVTVLSR